MAWVTPQNIVLLLAIGWLVLIAVRRAREPRLRIICAASEAVDLDLSTVIAIEFERFREEGGGSRLEVVESADHELDVPEAFSKTFEPLSAPLTNLTGFLRRTYELHVRFEEDDPTDLVMVGRLHAPFGRLIASTVIREGSFGVLSLPPGLHPGDDRAAVPPVPRAPATAQTPAADGPKRRETGDDGQAHEPADEAAEEAEAKEAAAKKDEGEPIDNAARRRRRRLGVAIAAWATYALVAGRRYERPAMLTKDWRSYALFRFGVDWQMTGNRAMAQRAYSEALDVDPFNRGALFNLGSNEGRRGCAAAAMAALQSAKLETERANPTIWSLATDRLWYRTVYNIGVVQHNESLYASPDPVCSLPKPAPAAAKDDVRELIRLAASAILAMERRRGSEVWARNQSLVGFLRMTQAAAIALLTDMERKR